METNAKNLFETMADMQKQAAETFSTATEQMRKSMMSNGMVDSDFFKKWYDSQMSFFNNNAANATENNPVSFFNNWMQSQVNTASEWMNTLQGNFRNMGAGAGMNEEMKKSYDQLMNVFNSWTNTMSNTYSEMLKNFQGNATSKDAFTGMFNNAEMYMKSFEFWMPMMKSIQDKSFTPELFKQYFNAPLFKEMLDKLFNNQPDFIKNMFENGMAGMKEQTNKMMDMNKAAYDNMKNMMNAGMPGMSNVLDSYSTNYNNMHNMFQNAAAPLMKLVTPGKNKEQMEAMSEIANEMNVFNINNAKMQYMMYTTGVKAMEEVAENIYGKLRNGEEISSFTTIYSDWLNTTDKNFVALFNTEEYSKMQGQVSAMGMKLKRHIDLQVENALSNIPVITRSEMDELYMTIHELKKRINMLEKQIDETEMPVATEQKEEAAAKPAAPAARKNGKNA